MAHIAFPKRAIHRLQRRQFRLTRAEEIAYAVVQLVERGAAAKGHVVHLVHRLRGIRCGGQHVGLNDIVDVAEIARRFAIAIDLAALPGCQLAKPAWNDCGIGTFGVLPRAEHIEIAQANGLHAVGASEHIGVKLVDVLGNSVG